MKVYRMGDCGVAVSINIDINGFTRSVTGWHVSSEKQAVCNLVSKLERVKTDAQEAINKLHEKELTP